ncbi:glycosyl hydrolase 115 family protein [Paraliobacillus sediminis]|uniref:glycosyl hydrolase 115 family protein n=1 Tax=Paraliobacillus sediminis TaxID=1885916 RepID=UPI000E3C86EC|nr:glycosyl hydrolase 115 family protein [Paraliobacillus sediminis]
MTNDSFIIDKDTVINIPKVTESAFQHGLDIFIRDFKKVIGHQPAIVSNKTLANLIIRYPEMDEDIVNQEESFLIRFTKMHNTSVMHLIGSDDLGIVFGLLYISKKYFGVDPFWFWSDIEIPKKSSVIIPIQTYDSEMPAVRYRGWFVNDEDCLIGWKEGYPPTEEVWLPVFEALLRCGGNMVIPGTDLPRDGIHFELASEMGLWITHHHAEPLGAEMFSRAYPNKKPSYKQHPALFEQLWEEAIIKQKHKKVLWVLSFRGQGDRPFWDHDPDYNTAKKRGGLISSVINRQFEMVKAHVQNPVCCMALYGEIAELYRQGEVTVPDGVIKIWADNGYGKMVSRRNGNTNQRVSTLPSPSDGESHGIYYHITFHDLQASNHLTMFPSSSELIRDELVSAFSAQANSYLLLNSGNVRPHLYQLDLVSNLWKKGNVNINVHLSEFISRLFSTYHDEIFAVYKDYVKITIQYGENKDDRAGDEFYHHTARKLIGHWLTGKTDQSLEKLHWATGDLPFEKQIEWFDTKCRERINKWQDLKVRCYVIKRKLNPIEQTRFQDLLIMQIELHESGCKGLVSLCESYYSYQSAKYPQAFVQASIAMRHYQAGIDVCKRSEHGKWKNFFSADWLTNMDITIYNLDTLRKYIRMYGDSPDFFLWYKAYLMPESEKNIYLENTHREPLSDDDLAEMLEKKFGF